MSTSAIRLSKEWKSQHIAILLHDELHIMESNFFIYRLMTINVFAIVLALCQHHFQYIAIQVQLLKIFRLIICTNCVFQALGHHHPWRRHELLNWSLEQFAVQLRSHKEQVPPTHHCSFRDFLRGNFFSFTFKDLDSLVLYSRRREFRVACPLQNIAVLQDVHWKSDVE